MPGRGRPRHLWAAGAGDHGEAANPRPDWEARLRPQHALLPGNSSRVRHRTGFVPQSWIKNRCFEQKNNSKLKFMLQTQHRLANFSFVSYFLLSAPLFLPHFWQHIDPGCSQCGERGHFSRDCPDTKYGYKRPPSPRGYRRSPSPRYRRSPSPRYRRSPSPRYRRSPSPRHRGYDRGYRRSPSPRRYRSRSRDRRY